MIVEVRYAVTKTATFAMGCFWSPEARFGSTPGVLRTRVGYTGGQLPSPTYAKLGDHTETVQRD
jgi:peptide-methionine (S)-S-oxide reductase